MESLLSLQSKSEAVREFPALCVLLQCYVLRHLQNRYCCSQLHEIIMSCLLHNPVTSAVLCNFELIFHK